MTAIGNRYLKLEEHEAGFRVTLWETHTNGAKCIASITEADTVDAAIEACTKGYPLNTIGVLCRDNVIRYPDGSSLVETAMATL